MDKPEILSMYKRKRYFITTDIETIQEDQMIYENLVKYYDRIISFDQLMEQVGDCCPINSCHWCNDICDNCDLHYKKCSMDDNERCKICWQRCLNKNIGGN